MAHRVIHRPGQSILRLYIGDLHMHTIYSHGTNSSLEMALASRNLGFDFIAITEHNTVRASRDARDLVEKYGLNLLVFLAEEAGSRAHILAIGMGEDIQRCRTERSAGRSGVRADMPSQPIPTGGLPVQGLPSGSSGSNSEVTKHPSMLSRSPSRMRRRSWRPFVRRRPSARVGRLSEGPSYM